MLNWRYYYNTHIMSAERALRQIHSGDRVAVGHACNEPAYLLEMLAERAAEYRDVELVHLLSLGKCATCGPEYAGHFRHNTLFVSQPVREAVAAGRADFTPCFFSEVPGLFSTALPLNAALVTVTPPDENGNCSLGLAVDYTLEAVKRAKTVIAQVNREMPFTLGQSMVHVTEIDCFVPHDAPIPQLSSPQLGSTEKTIGAYISSLVRDGDTLQLGIGTIPDAVLLSLKDKQDLGIHTEMFSDGVVDLVEAGVITNSRKTLHPGKSVAAFLMGTNRLYRYVDRNPDVFMAPVDYVNSPWVVGQNENLVSINSCLQVDLTGQVAAESIGCRQISGVGGQVDFVRGAALSKGGRSIIAMPSTAAKGTLSRIVPVLDEGAAVTTSRNDVDYIVTEYGIAHLKGRSLRQRAEALIDIAHPDFRAELRERWARRLP